MSTKTNANTKKLTVMAMLSAVAYIVMFFGRIPIVSFLKYDPKDVIITIGGFIYGPVASLVLSFVVSFIEMMTASETGPIGLVMNMVSSCSFACSAAFIYKRNRTLKGAVIGLGAGLLLATAIMMLWNYALTPIYMGYPRGDVAAMLLPVFLPFNLLKNGLNAAITMLLYKPVIRILRYSRMMEAPESTPGSGGINIGVILASAFVILTCVLLILVYQGKM